MRCEDAQHSLAQGLTKEDNCLGNAKLEHTFSHRAAQASMKIIELEHRCTGNRTEGSRMSLPSANTLVLISPTPLSSCDVVPASR